MNWKVVCLDQYLRDDLSAFSVKKSALPGGKAEEGFPKRETFHLSLGGEVNFTGRRGGRACQAEGTGQAKAMRRSHDSSLQILPKFRERENLGHASTLFQAFSYHNRLLYRDYHC